MQQVKPATLGLIELVGILQRRWTVILATVVVCGLGGIVLGLVAPKTYTATASLTVSPITTDPFSSAAVNQQINITTERAILSSGEVAALAAKELGEEASPGSLQRNATTAAPSGSQILEVSVTLPNAQKAADQANALANAYLQFRSLGASEVAAGYIKQIDDRIKGLDQENVLTPSQVQQLQDLQQQRNALTLASASPGRVIGYATPSAYPSSMGVLVFTVAGIAAGLLLGAALAMLRERMDPRIRSAARLRKYFHNQVVVLGDKDQESVRWIVRIVRKAGPRTTSDRTIFVGVIALPGGGPVGLTTWMARLTRAHNLDVITVWGSNISAEAVDLGWPDRGTPSEMTMNDVVYVAIDESLSGTRIADLAERMDYLVVTAGRVTRISRINDTLALINGSIPTARITPVYHLPSRSQRKRHGKVHSPVVVPGNGDLSGSKKPAAKEPHVKAVSP